MAKIGRKPKPYRLEKRGKYWYYKTPSDGHFRTTGKTSRADAAEFVENYRATRGLQAFTFFEEYAGAYFGENCPWWTRENARRQTGIEGVKDRPILKSTRDAYFAHLYNHIMPRFGHIRIEDMRPVDWYTWLYDLNYASQTKKHIRRAAIIILEDMRRDGLIRWDPRRDIPSPVVTHAKKTPPSPQDARRLFPENRDDFKAIWGPKAWRVGAMLALEFSTGLRTEEARALDIRAVDWELPGLKVVEAVNRDGIIGGVKADSFRVVLIPKRILPLLLEVKGDRIEGPLFLGRTGGILDAGAAGHRLKPVVAKIKKEDEAAGLRAEERRIPSDAHFTPHGLRHAYNTIMRMILKAAGQEGLWDQDKMTIQIQKHTDNILRAFTGHRTEKMTEHYNHPDLAEALEFYEKNFRQYVEQIWTFGEKAGQ